MAIEIVNIIESIRSHHVRITDHADEEAHANRLNFEEIFYSVIQGEIIEEYPTDFPFPSCLIFGKTFKGDPVHSVWAYNNENLWAVLITVYRPNPDVWIDYRIRK